MRKEAKAFKHECSFVSGILQLLSRRSGEKKDLILQPRKILNLFDVAEGII